MLVHENGLLQLRCLRAHTKLLYSTTQLISKVSKLLNGYMTEFLPIAGTKNFRLAVSHAAMNPRKRSTMEDVHRVVEQLDGDPKVSYFGVYDGHGGRKIVDFLEPNLEKHVAQELKLPDDASVEERLTRAFLIADVKSRELDLSTSGATAIVCVIQLQPDGSRVLYAANVGDSRAVLCCKKEDDSTSSGNSNEATPAAEATDAPSAEAISAAPAAEATANAAEDAAENADSASSAAASIAAPFQYSALRLSFDHRAEDPGEQARIKEAGGFIARGRVLGILAVSRSFGDHGMKQFVTAQPYVTTTNLPGRSSSEDTSESFPFLILACDGVWDVYSDQEAVDLILRLYRANGCRPVENAAEVLVQGSLERGSTDNITVVVVFL